MRTVSSYVQNLVNNSLEISLQFHKSSCAYRSQSLCTVWPLSSTLSILPRTSPDCVCWIQQCKYTQRHQCCLSSQFIKFSGRWQSSTVGPGFLRHNFQQESFHLGSRENRHWYVDRGNVWCFYPILRPRNALHCPILHSLKYDHQWT